MFKISKRHQNDLKDVVNFVNFDKIFHTFFKWNQKISEKFQDVIELQPSVQCSSQNENFVNTSKKYRKIKTELFLLHENICLKYFIHDCTRKTSQKKHVSREVLSFIKKKVVGHQKLKLVTENLTICYLRLVIFFNALKRIW